MFEITISGRNLAQVVFAEMPISIMNRSGDTLLRRHGLVSLPHCPFLSSYQQTQIRKQHIVCARKKSRQHGSAIRSRKLVQSAFYIASKLKILPEPMDFFIQEFGIGGGGNRGGFSGFRKGFGWGGFDDRWRPGRSKRKLDFLVILLVSGFGLWFVLGKRLNSGDAFLGGFGGLALFGLSIHGWRRGLKDWILGFCCCTFLVSMVMKKEDFQKLMESSSTILKKKMKTHRLATSFAAMASGGRRKW